jgi:4-diphosphocytidyl-2-C-methyl-D-erythritol kinase
MLRVLARESSGYHQIETLYCRIALGDTVRVTVTEDERSLQCIGEVPAGDLGPVEDNLAWRAAAAYAERARWPGGFAIQIEKRIPVGAGLGGGSADAGAVLRALNMLSPVPLSARDLLAVAGSLGSDVPFLTQDVSALALAWGRGERLLVLDSLPERRCWLLSPGVAVSTRDAYEWLAQAPPSRSPSLFDVGSLTSWDRVGELAANDFEGPVSARIPLIAKLLATLRSAGAANLVGVGAITQLSGSGSTVFALAGRDPRDGTHRFGWRSDEPGAIVIETRTSERVEAVELID